MRFTDTPGRSHKSSGRVDRLHEVAPSRTRRFHDGEGRQPTKGALLTTLEVAQRLGLSEQRVRQLEARALAKLRGSAVLKELANG